MLVKIQDGPVMLEDTQVTYIITYMHNFTKIRNEKLSLLKLGNHLQPKVCTLYSYTAVTRPFSAQDHPQKWKRHKRLIYKRFKFIPRRIQTGKTQVFNAWMVLPPASEVA